MELSNRQETIKKYWMARVADIKQENPYFDKNQKTLLEDIIKVTHGGGDNIYIFWIAPDGKVVEAPEGHDIKTEHTTGPEEYEKAGYLRGRVATMTNGQQVILLYAGVNDMLGIKRKLRQLKNGIKQFPVPINGEAVIVVNGDILGTVGDLESGQLG